MQYFTVQGVAVGVLTPLHVQFAPTHATSILFPQLYAWLGLSLTMQVVE
jgi:hypothetical protein